MAELDFLIIKGRDRSVIAPQTPSAQRYAIREFASKINGVIVIDAEHTDEIEKMLTDAGWTVTVR